VLKKTAQKWSTLKLSTPTELKAGSGYCRAKDKWRAVQDEELLIGYFIDSGQVELGPSLYPDNLTVKFEQKSTSFI
jgi:hypothetical protein